MFYVFINFYGICRARDFKVGCPSVHESLCLFLFWYFFNGFYLLNYTVSSNLTVQINREWVRRKLDIKKKIAFATLSIQLVLIL